MTIDWSEPAPESLGFDAGRLAEAVAFHRHHESPWPGSMYLPEGRYVGTASVGDRPEHAAVIGPVRARGGPNGIVLRRGRVAAEFLLLNGYRLPVDDAENIVTWLALAAGNLGEADLAHWLRDRVMPLR